MHKGFLKTAAILAALAVGLGAFAAHALKGQITDKAIEIFQTGVKYQMYHAFALLASAMLYQNFTFNIVTWACRFFVLGIILFSGSLYVMAYVTAFVKPGYSYLGALTPIGGLLFICGWLCLFIAFFKSSKLQNTSK